MPRKRGLSIQVVLPDSLFLHDFWWKNISLNRKPSFQTMWSFQRQSFQTCFTALTHLWQDLLAQSVLFAEEIKMSFFQTSYCQTDHFSLLLTARIGNNCRISGNCQKPGITVLCKFCRIFYIPPGSCNHWCYILFSWFVTVQLCQEMYKIHIKACMPCTPSYTLPWYKLDSCHDINWIVAMI